MGVASGLSASLGLAPLAAAAVPEASAALAAGRRLIDILVTASTNARASTPSPTSWAPTTGAPSGRADVFATVLALALLPCPPVPPAGVGEGLSVGNSPPALPPGLSVLFMPLFMPFTPVVPFMPLTNGKLSTDSGEALTLGLGVGEVLGVVTGAAVTEIAADACGSLERFAALAMTVSLTDVTEVAVAGIAVCA